MDLKERTSLAQYTEIYGKVCENMDTVPESYYEKYGVKKGLRDINGNGVLSGLTHISKIIAFEYIDGVKTPCDGQLWYRGYNIYDLVHGFSGKCLGYEEITYLLLFGKLPNKKEIKEFKQVLSTSRTLPKNFTRDIIMKAPSKDIMNSITILVLFQVNSLIKK